MPLELDTPTAEQRAGSYSDALDSVNLINGNASAQSTDQEWKDCLQRNVDHLEIMVAKTYWEGEDLSPLTAAIAAGKTKIAAI